jgi:hypothetical protein
MATAKKKAAATTTVYITRLISGARNGVAWPAIGETATLPAAEAANLCAMGNASLEAPEAR